MKKIIETIKASLNIDNSYGTWKDDYNSLLIEDVIAMNKKGIACECNADVKQIYYMED